MPKPSMRSIRSVPPPRRELLIMSRVSKRLGVLFILSVWLVSGVVVIVLGTLLSMYVDSSFLPKTSLQEDVTVIDIAGFAFLPDSSAPESTTYFVRLPSGETIEVAFPGNPELSLGAKYHMNYTRTMLFKKVDVVNFHKL